MAPGSEHAQYIRAGSDRLPKFVNVPHLGAAWRTCVFFHQKHDFSPELPKKKHLPQPQAKIPKYLVSLDTQGLGREYLITPAPKTEP